MRRKLVRIRRNPILHLIEGFDHILAVFFGNEYIVVEIGCVIEKYEEVLYCLDDFGDCSVLTTGD